MKGSLAGALVDTLKHNVAADLGLALPLQPFLQLRYVHVANGARNETRDGLPARRNRQLAQHHRRALHLIKGETIFDSGRATQCDQHIGQDR